MQQTLSSISCPNAYNSQVSDSIPLGFFHHDNEDKRQTAREVMHARKHLLSTPFNIRHSPPCLEHRNCLFYFPHPGDHPGVGGREIHAKRGEREKHCPRWTDCFFSSESLSHVCMLVQQIIVCRLENRTYSVILILLNPFFFHPNDIINMRDTHNRWHLIFLHHHSPYLTFSSFSALREHGILSEYGLV